MKKNSLPLLLFLLLLALEEGCKKVDPYHPEKRKTMVHKDKEEKKANRLIHEKSPYLLQHAHNPVDWYPWGKEAFEKAKKEDKPIFLSIGYSTCHWCHVMERESFEDKEVADLLNKTFVCIKVDREERPDIDQIYMQYCIAVNQSGGWPLTILMSSDQKPFFAGTYFPKKGRFGRPGLMELIPHIQKLWSSQRKELSENSEKVALALDQMSQNTPGKALSRETLKKAYELLRQNFDSASGGFGHAPKFPVAHNLLFLLRYWKRTGETKALDMVEKTLIEMRRGGLYDQLGYGFHRYSTDHRWLLPHFEKMLYDQALLSMAYLEAFQATGKEDYRETAREIFTYVLRDMTDSKGGFYSAEDADSEGVEGKFYLWTESAIIEALGKEEGAIFLKVYNTSKGGNFQEEAGGPNTEDNILHIRKAWKEISEELKIPEGELKSRMEKSRTTLFALREKRIHPHKDDKILTDWNGLMMAALAMGGRILEDDRFTQKAQKALEFIMGHLRKKDGSLLHRYRGGQGALDGYLDDYTFLIWALLELYESTFDPSYLKTALEFNNHLLDHFWDQKGGCFFFTSRDGETLLARPKEIYDGALPSGNSIALWNLLKLSKITGNPKFEKLANQLNKAFSERIEHYPAGYTQFLIGTDFGLGPTSEVVLVGSRKNKTTEEMVKVLRRSYFPCKVVVFVPTDQRDSEIFKLADYTSQYAQKEGQNRCYVCQNYECHLPTSDPKKIIELLEEKK